MRTRITSHTKSIAFQKQESCKSRSGRNKFTHKHFLIVPIFLMAMLWSGLGWGQQSIVTLGSATTQNFTIGTSGTASLPTGFKIGTDWSSGTTATTLAYGTTGTGVVTGTSGGGVINWANGITGSSTERSIGFLSSGSYTSPRSIIYAFTNNTGSTVTSIDLAWNYEKSRSGTRAFDWTFFHGNTSTASTAETSGNQSYAEDANNTVVSNPPLSTAKSFSISGLSIANGTTYYIRWTYTGNGGSTNAQGLSIDDFSITLNAATPSITLSSTNPSVAAANITQSTTKNPIYKFTTDITTANATLNSVTFSTTNTAAADVTKYQLWYKTSDDLSTATQLGSDITTSLGTGSHTFSGLSQVINSGTTGYFWITTDVSGSATPGNTLNVSTIATTDLSFAAGSVTGTAYSGGIQTIVSSGTPTISVGSLTAFSNQCINTTSTEKSYSVSGSNLSTDIILTPPAGFEISTTSGSGFVANPSTITLNQSGGTVTSTTIYVRFIPTAVTSYSANITHTSASATTKNVAVSGSGINTLPSITVGTAGSITTTSASVSGNTISALGCSSVTAYGVEYSTTNGFSNGTGTAVAGTGFSGSAGGTFTASLSSLSPSTTYYFHAYATNNGGTVYSTQGSFTTACTNFTLPYSQGFNAATIPACWSTQTVVGTSAIQFVASSSNPATTPQEGTHYVFWNSFASGWPSGNETRLISPPITTTGTASVNVKFYWMNENSTSYNSGAYLNEGVLVQYSTDGSTWDAGTFYARYDGSLPSGTNQWNLKTLTLPAGAGNQSTIYVSFKFHSSYGDNCSLDNVVVEANVIKPEPTNQPTAFACGTTTVNTIPLTWTAANPGTQAPDGYLILWSTGAITAPVDGVAQADGAGVKNISYGTNAYTVTGLSSNTSYNFQIWSYTNSGSSIDYKLSGAPTTSCATTVAPWEDFETGTKASYTAGNVTCTAGQWYMDNALIGTSASDRKNGSKSVRITATGSIYNTFNITTGLSNVTVYHALYGSDASCTWQLSASTDNGATWTAYQSSPITTSSTTLNAQVFPVNLSGNVRIKIQRLSGASGDRLNIDDIYITPYALFGEPTNYPTAFSTNCGSATSSSIPLTWTDASAGTVPSGYLIQWNTSGTFTDPVDGTPQSDASFASYGVKNVGQGMGTYSVTGLTSNTLYYFKIWSYTNSGSNINYKTGPTPPTANCTTLEDACIDESFEASSSALPSGWTNNSVTIGTSGACDGTNRLIYNAAGDYFITPALNYPQQLTFQYKRSSDATAWSVKVQTSTNVGGPWDDVATISGASTNCQTATVSLSAYTGATKYVKLIDTRSSGTNERYIDDVKIYCSNASCIAPTVNATNLTFASIGDASMTLNFTSGDGTKRMVIATEAVAGVTFSPTDNITYPANASYSSGTSLNANGDRVIYSGTGSSASISGLTGGTTYYFKIIEFNCSNGMEKYYTVGNLTGSQTTLPSPVTSLSVTCQTGTEATISWTAPDGNFDGVIIGVRNSTLDCHTISDDANSYNANPAFSSGTQYGSTTPYSFVVYKGTGTTVTVTGLTAGQNYKIKAYTYKGATGSSWSSTPTTSISSLGVPNVTSLAASPLNASAQINWTNPSGACWNEVMVVAKISPAVTAIPTGDGTSYTADPVFGSGTLFDGGRVVYKGNSNSVTVTGLTNGTNYCFKVYTRTGTSWSSGVSACATPLVGTTAYVPGSIAVLGVCSNMYPCGFGNQDGDDEISIVTFQDITPGTSFDMTDNGWEKCITGKWGNAEGYMRIRRTGATIPAGTIITFRLTQQSVGSHFTCLYPDNNWSVDIEEGSLILNKNGDQIYFMQGGIWNQGTAGNNDATYTGGKLLFAFNTNSTWTRMICTASNVPAGTGRSQNSGLALNMECFNMVPNVATDYLKYVGDLSPTTQRGWMERIKDGDNWNAFSDCAAYYSGTPDYLNTVHSITISAGGGGYTPGLWTGAQNQDWFYCGNWGNMLVPDKDVDVVLPADATYAVANNCVIGIPPTGYTEASCKSFTNNLTSKAILINNAASKLDIWGNFSNNATFTHNAGIVTFKGITAQTLGGTNVPTFYDLTLNNSNGLTVNSNIFVTNSFNLTSGVVTTGSNIIDLGSTGSITEGASTTAPTSYVTGILKSTRNIGGGANQTFGSIGLEINEPGTSNSTQVIRTTGVTITAGNPSATSIKRYFDITPTTNSGLNATMIFHYFDHEILGFTEADLELYKSPSPYTTWYSQVGAISTGANTSTKSGITGFSRWTLASKNAPLPIELLQFEAVCNGEQVDLLWTTASEINNDFFTIEKSNDFKLWKEVGKIAGAGNSNILSSYKYSDDFSEGNTVYYRLKQTDFDGTTVTFDPIIVKCEEDYQGINLYPNPSTSNTICSVYSSTERTATIEITNFYGAKVFQKNVELIQGFNIFDIDVSGFQTGLYHVVIRTTSGKNIGYKQLIVQK